MIKYHLDMTENDFGMLKELSYYLSFPDRTVQYSMDNCFGCFYLNQICFDILAREYSGNIYFALYEIGIDGYDRLPDGTPYNPDTVLIHGLCSDIDLSFPLYEEICNIKTVKDFEIYLLNRFINKLKHRLYLMYAIDNAEIIWADHMD